ncbi:hypothetical protein PR048_004462 [Dryococelus australis]|uniref:Uncharacterized protein n=1 Tax=Dryococelus australis TaxID=614101 RepID=A0ABQ9I6B9_9NEOP|nr:hypothetical protein PR048_004462 [Dryococelus australis]
MIKIVMVCAVGYVGTLQQLNSTLAQLDVLTSFAEAAACAPKPYVRPKFVEDGEPRVMCLKQLRHPCLEMQEGVSFIANDVDFKEGQLLLLTSVNYGDSSCITSMTAQPTGHFVYTFDV